MHHDAHGWWIAEAGEPPRLAPLAGDTSADVVVIGGGYTGLWAAWHLAEAGATAIVLEAGRCGHGPSGRNGGFVSPLAPKPPSPGARPRPPPGPGDVGPAGGGGRGVRGRGGG